MQVLTILGVLLVSYLIGSIPFGFLVVRFFSGKDIRKIASGRTGGTNAMRAAGFWAGLATAILDVMKGAFVVWLAGWVYPDFILLKVLAPVAAVIGHNYSIFIIERKDGRIHLRGGAGGAPTVGGALGLWAPSILIIIPAGALILFGIGYASVATMSVAFLATLIFAYRALMGISPWQYILYGLATEIILVIALIPNIRRLLKGNERVVGWRARHLQNKQQS
jgi:glycerol-3-phosphate acyltransferase PlsY